MHPPPDPAPAPENEGTPGSGRAPAAIVILAAGLSRRFGATNKLLAPFAGRPLLAHALGAARAAGCGPVIVVTGHDAAAVTALACSHGAGTIFNPDYRSGMASSVAAGARAVPAAVRGIFILPGDMPRIGPEIFAALCATRPGEGEILRPEVVGRPGHPVWFGRAFLPELAALGAGDRGGATVIARHPARLRLLPLSAAGAALDIDTQTDLDAAGA